MKTSGDLLCWDQDLVSIYLGWNNYEAALAEEDSYMAVDIFVGPELKPYEFESRVAVKHRLNGHLANMPSDHPYKEYTEARIGAASLILTVLDGQATPTFSELMARTQHVPVTIVPTARIRAQRQKIEGLLRRDDIGFDRDSIKAYEKAFVIRSEDAIRQKFEAGVRWGEQTAASIIPMPPDGVIKLETVNKNLPWQAQVETGQDGNLVTYLNTHPRFKHTAGNLVALALHEIIGHWAHAKKLEAAIYAKKILPSAGLLTLHGPEVVQNEAVAHAVVQSFLKDEPGSRGGNGYSLGAAMDAYATMVKHNMHVAVNTGGTPEEAAHMAANLLPFEEFEHLLDSATKRKDRLDFKCYFGSDWLALQPVLEGRVAYLLPENKRQVFEKLMSGPLLYEAVRQTLGAKLH